MALPAEAFVTYRVGNLRFFLQRHLWTQGQRQRHPPVTERHLWTQRQRQKHPAGLRAVHEQGCVPRLQRYKSRDTNSSERCTSKAIKSGERYAGRATKSRCRSDQTTPGYAHLGTASLCCGGRACSAFCLLSPHLSPALAVVCIAVAACISMHNYWMQPAQL
eukprot:scaffold1_cov19-Tisochrysis_lutea.AAC.2